MEVCNILWPCFSIILLKVSLFQIVKNGCLKDYLSIKQFLFGSHFKIQNYLLRGHFFKILQSMFLIALQECVSTFASAIRIPGYPLYRHFVIFGWKYDRYKCYLLNTFHFLFAEPFPQHSSCPVHFFSNYCVSCLCPRVWRMYDAGEETISPQCAVEGKGQLCRFGSLFQPL